LRKFGRLALLADMTANRMVGDLTHKSLWLKPFEELPGPRLNRKKRHMLMDILVLTLCAVICGATNWESIEDYGNKKKDWLKTFLMLKNSLHLVPHKNIQFVSAVCSKSPHRMISDCKYLLSRAAQNCFLFKLIFFAV
jgi:hypothetical protein